MNWAAIFWLAALIFFLAVESSTVTLVSIWFAAGSLAALFAALIWQDLIWLQASVFLVVAGLSLAALRPIVRKHFKPKIVRTNTDVLLGSQGYVSSDIDNVSAKGSVKLGAMEWTARSTTGEEIAAGTLVRVDRIEGVKAYVTVVEVKETVN